MLMFNVKDVWQPSAVTHPKADWQQAAHKRPDS